MLSGRQVDILRAVVNRIIPADDFPGGWDGGVGDYLFGQFERDLKNQAAVYAAGLDSLTTEAQAVYHLDFGALSTYQQDELLAKVEVGDVNTVWLVNPITFFATLTQHCAEGYYSDPGNGGNRDEISWKMIGFEVRDGKL